MNAVLRFLAKIHLIKMCGKKLCCCFLKNIWEIVLGILVFVVFFFALQNTFFVTLVDKINFTLFSWSAHSSHEDIVIVALDDETINHPGFKRFQDISRADYAKVIKNIFADDPKGIGIDVFFYNASQDDSEDEALANVLREHENIFLANEFDMNEQELLFVSESLGVPISRQGYINLLTSSFDEQVVVNQVPLIFDATTDISSAKFEPLTFRLWRLLHDRGSHTAKYDEETEIYTLISGDKMLDIPTKNQFVNINFFGKPGDYQRYSFYDVWTGTVPLGAFDDRIVLIGATAKDIHDEFVTPVSATTYMPGVEIHANLLQTLLDQKFLTYQDKDLQKNILALSLVIALIIFLFASFWWASFLTILLIFLFYFGAVFLFREHSLIVDFTTPIFALLLFGGGNYIIRYLEGEKKNKEVRNTFSKYVSKDVVDTILKNPEKVDMEGEQKEVSVFFSDLEGFTSLAETLPSSETMKILNNYLDKMSSIILEEKGTIDKYIGDSIMAYWGAPIECEKHANLACRVALQQQQALPEINKILKERGFTSLVVRIGIHSGKVTAGNIGTLNRLEYTVIGDNVNLASRLEAINKVYKTRIIISEDTKNFISDDEFLIRKIDRIRVQGRTQPVSIFELMTFRELQTKEQEEKKKIYEEGLDYYFQQQWKDAGKMFSSMPDDAIAITMKERIKDLKKRNLDTDWDGTFTFVTK